MKKPIVYDGRELQYAEPQMNAARDVAMLEFLTQFITDERKQRFEEVLDFRTRHITVVLEDIFQPHNASAVLRSCELRGIQDVHIVENNNRYDVNPDVVLGSTKWLNMYYYEKGEFNTPEAYRQLHLSAPRRFHTRHLTIGPAHRLGLRHGEAGPFGLCRGKRRHARPNPDVRLHGELQHQCVGGFVDVHTYQPLACLLRHQLAPHGRGAQRFAPCLDPTLTEPD